ncbi:MULTISPECIES: S1 family peptidase [Brevibacterium]|uniref:Hemagglutinin n=1 Tax=Brevibacterium casei TaxID=33889 RepID=A0A165D0L4_9MICO|nr:S1 family peptidase [Brevibacterium casei]KZE09963.1 hemagglutinin [Brevibacterium casei]MCT1448231.1 S1 family peptidase [Brevibacterium casei]MCT2359681.1 S1 family peptidase [Brevibacterium casei]MDH5149540.1 S1 family peptidase [Brevibacterium casei]PAK96343.1 hemagglutinin [Brevibacterium casei]
MQKRLVQSSLALTAATALSLGSAFFASPAMAAEAQTLDVQSDKQIQKALSDIEGVNAYGERNGKLSLGVEKKTAEIKELEKKFTNIKVTEGIKELKPYAKNDVVGGAGYLANTPAGAGVCSTGFSGWDDAGKPVILTAGHCSKDYNADTGEIKGDSVVGETEQPSSAEANGGEGFVKSGLGVLGTWGYTSYGSGDLLDPNDPNPPLPKEGDIDFAVINVDESKYTVKNGVTDWSTADSDDLSAKLATNIAKVGSHTEGKVQKSGRTTGLTEGQVIPRSEYDFDYTNVGGYWVHGFGVTSPGDKPFSQPGDSGGAVFQGDTAVGVISGGGPLSDGTQFGWVADLDYSLEQSGQSFNIEKPGTETPEAPAAPKAEDQTIKPKGEVKGKAAADAEVKLEWKPASKAGANGTQAASEGSKTVKADADGNFALEGPEAPGKYDYSAVAVVDGQQSEATTFTVTVEEEKTETPAPVERDITVDPKEIAASDFVKKDKAVTISVKGFDEGEKVSLKLVSGPENVKGIELDETANADGEARFSIYGTSASDPSVYVGKYDVSVTGANDTEDESALSGSFKVVADDQGNGGGSDDGKDGGDGGSDLPRTGAELTGLAAGAGLLLVGGAAVVLTMRRVKKN